MSSQRQKKAIKLLIKNSKAEKPLSMEKILLEAGYAPSTARASTAVVVRKSWKELLETMFPDELLSEIHLELLKCEDKRVIMEALKEAYKLKDKYPEQKNKIIGLFESVLHQK